MTDKPEIPGMELLHIYRCLTCDYRTEDKEEAKKHSKLPKPDKPLRFGLCFKQGKSTYVIVGNLQSDSISWDHAYRHKGEIFIPSTEGLDTQHYLESKHYHSSMSSRNVREKLKTGEYSELNKQEIEMLERECKSVLRAVGIEKLVRSEKEE